jgi:hypothetical protein
MAKLRLTQGMRDTLERRAGEWIACPKELKALNAAYAKAAPLVTKAVEAKYPSKDMAILLKYEVAARDQCIRVQAPDGYVREFQYKAVEEAPYAAKTRYCGSRIYLANATTAEAVERWEDASNAYKEAHKQKCADYYALIRAANYLEEIEAIWPAASEIRARYQANLPAAVTDDVISRIRADVSARLKEAA